MKKISKYLLFLLIIFIGFNVKALDASYCDGASSACAICEYIINDGTNTKVIYNVKSTNGSIDFTENKTGTSGNVTVTSANIAANNFYSKSQDKLSCPSSLKRGMVSSGRSVTYYVSFTETKWSNVTLNGTVPLSESYNNDKVVTSSTDELHSCTYKDNNSGVSIEVLYNTTSIKYDGGDYNVTYTDYTVSDFKNGCPVAYLTCTTRDGKNCSLRKEAQSGFTNEITPVDTPSADEISNPSSSLDDTNAGTPDYDCGSLIGPNVLAFIQLILNLVMIIGPIIAMTLGMYDIFMAMAKGEDDDKKKAFKKLKYRIIATVLLLILPYIIKTLLTIVGKGDSMCL